VEAKMADVGKHFLKDVRTMQEEMDLLFDHFYRMKQFPILASRRLWRPPTDVLETENEVVITMEVAGMSQQDFSIALNENLLTISGNRKFHPGNDKAFFRNMEINSGEFERNFQLPESIDPEGVSATYRQGFLIIRIGKRVDKKSKPKEIKVE